MSQEPDATAAAAARVASSEGDGAYRASPAFAAAASHSSPAAAASALRAPPCRRSQSVSGTTHTHERSNVSLRALRGFYKVDGEGNVDTAKVGARCTPSAWRRNRGQKTHRVA